MNAWYCPLRPPVPVNIRLSPFTLKGSLFSPSVAATTVTAPLVPPIAPTGGVAAETCAPIVADPAPATVAKPVEENEALSAIVTLAGTETAPGLLLVSRIVSGWATLKLEPKPGAVRLIEKSSGADSVLRKVSSPLNCSEEADTATGALLERKWGAETAICTPTARPPSPFSPASPLPTRVEIRPVAGSSRRIWWFDESAIRTWPAALIDNPSGVHRSAVVAVLPLPLEPPVPVPAARRVVSSGGPPTGPSAPGAARGTRR